MDAAVFLSSAKLMQGGSIADEGTLLGMLLKLDQMHALDRERSSLRSEKLGALSAPYAAVLLREYRDMPFAD
jgi:hypothetical protein